jgi:hypothetical protein
MELLRSRSKKMPSGCVEWIGPRSWLNYGVFDSRIMGRMGAHRAAWILNYGDIPKGMSVLHSCNNPPCVNPKHLKLGDHLANMQDRKLCGNYPKGENHFAAKVTDKIAVEIFNDPRTCRIIAENYGVNRYLVQSIRTGQTYSHVTGGGRSPFQRPKGCGVKGPRGPHKNPKETP